MMMLILIMNSIINIITCVTRRRGSKRQAGTLARSKAPSVCSASPAREMPVDGLSLPCVARLVSCVAGRTWKPDLKLKDM